MTTLDHPSTHPRASAVPDGLYRIGDQTFRFSAAHRLTEVPVEHKARRLHGHTYSVEVELADTVLNGPGFVADYADLAPVGDYLKREVDHRDLTALFAFETTTDQIEQHLTDWLLATMNPELGKQLQAVRVSIDASSRTQPPADPGGPVARFGFDAAHQLGGLPAGHKCGRLHGHSYTADLRFDPDLDAGVRDEACAAFGEYLDRELDYRNLSELLPFEATSELLAEHLYGWILTGTDRSAAAAVRAVRVWESPRRWAEFSTIADTGQ